MSYTAPQYVYTKEQAILALASTIKGEAVTGGDGSVNKALDILADVLAEQDVQVPQTDAGAILALAQYASGMVKPEGTIAITENGEGIDVAQYATADVSVSGGGGDFTTCTVTITNESEKDFILEAPYINGGMLKSAVLSMDMDGSPIEVVLYGDGTLAFVTGDGGYDIPDSVTCTGSLSYEAGAITIEGDGTLTFSD